jgi:hypothetical protein
MEESFTKKIIFSEIWEKVKSTIPRHFDERRPNEYRTEDFGVIYRNTLSHTLQKLGIETKRRNKFVELIFHPKKIMKVASQYGIPIQTKFYPAEGERSERSERSIDSLVKYEPIVEEKKDDNIAEIATVCNENGLNIADDELKDTFVNTSEDNKDDPPYIEPSQHTPHSPIGDEQEAINSGLYRIGKTDTWGCEKCSLRDDKWFMQQHPCKGA